MFLKPTDSEVEQFLVFISDLIAMSVERLAYEGEPLQQRRLIILYKLECFPAFKGTISWNLSYEKNKKKKNCIILIHVWCFVFI